MAGAALVAVVLVVLIIWGARRGTAALVTATARRGELVIDIATTGQVEAVKSRSVSRAADRLVVGRGPDRADGRPRAASSRRATSWSSST